MEADAECLISHQCFCWSGLSFPITKSIHILFCYFVIYTCQLWWFYAIEQYTHYTHYTMYVIS